MIQFEVLTVERAALYLADMPGNAKWDTTDGLCNILEIIAGGAPFMVRENGVEVMVIVLDLLHFDAGKELQVRVARQLVKSVDMTERLLPEIENNFGGGCVAVTLRTRRAGLVRKLEKVGYYETAKIMRKKLQ